MPDIHAAESYVSFPGSSSLADTGRTEKIEIDTVSFKIRFRVGDAVIDPTFADNSTVLGSLDDFLGKLRNDTARHIEAVRISGSVSPEGPMELNLRLAEDRTKSLRYWMRENLGLEAGTVSRRVPGNIRELSMLASASAKTIEEVYSDLRYAEVDFVIDTSVWTEYRKETVSHPCIIPVMEENVTVGEVVEEETAIVPDITEISYPWHVKTNFIGWAMLVTNVAVELDFGNRWSVAVPVYYSGFNYFTRTLKFRTFTVQPELRFWFKDHSDTDSRWFVGAHIGLGWYNYALDGDYRIQDASRKRPSWGGGVSAGYRVTLPWGTGSRWKMEFTLGAGVYDNKYDKFLNKTNGLRVRKNIHNTFVGLDQVAVSLIYSFN